MKITYQNLLFVGSIALLPTMLFAQEKELKKEKIRVRVEQNIDGKKEIKEETIDVAGMNNKDRDILIEKIQDSLSTKGSGKKMTQMKVIIQDDADVETDDYVKAPNGEDKHIIIKRMPRGGNPRNRASEDDRNFEYHIERFGDRVREFGDELPRRLDFNGPVYTWDDQIMEGRNTPSIRGLEVFPNQPESEILNIRFSTPTKGNISIKVLDIEGNVVEKKEIKDFAGEFVGQINLKKGSTGTYFIIVTQNKDGISKRVVLR